MARFKEMYEDIMEERRHTSDLKYSLKQRKDVPQYKHCHPRSSSDIKKHVLKSERVRYVVEKISEEQGVSQDAVMKEATEIINEMAHQLNVTTVRGVAFGLIKVFKSLFTRVYVNEEGVQRMRKMLQDYPIILMPSHRSYLDFLLVSYICYQYDIPLPVIAAAMDFKNMAFFGWLLRNCGAFYIRRSFGSDKLYWAVFTEYVQTHLRNGDAPVEFFVEGTRSRTNKSYQPRIGMLSAALESYFKAEVPDVVIFPISISYERILEEAIYAYELLGVPKPKESASGVFKARSILKENFGCIHLHIGEPISIRQLSDGLINRSVHNLEPRYINNLTSGERGVVKKLSYEILRVQQQHFVISPWSLMAAILMQNPDGIAVKQMVKEVNWLKRQAYNLAAYVDWPGNASSDSVVKHYIGLHSNVVTVRENIIHLKIEKLTRVRSRDLVMANAAVNLMLGSYRNQVLHVFVPIALVALSVNSCDLEHLPQEELYKKYCFLESVLSQDFVFQPGSTEKTFQQALLMLSNSGALFVEGGFINIKKSINKHTTFLSQMFEPFLLGYWVVCQHLLSLTHDVHGRPLPKKPKEIAQDVQNLVVYLLQQRIISHYEILSLDLINNALKTLIDLNAMHKDRRNEETYISPKTVAVSNIAIEIAKFIEVPAVPESALVQSRKTILIPAKL